MGKRLKTQPLAFPEFPESSRRILHRSRPDDQTLGGSSMGKHISRSGGKYGGAHTTLTHTAALVANIANKSPLVSKISPGHINPGKGRGRSKRRVVIVMLMTCVKLNIKGDGGVQEVRVFGSEMRQIASWLQDQLAQDGFDVTYRDQR